MAVLVTGGAGFIGSHLADRLLDSGHGVVVVDDLSAGFVSNVPLDAIFVRGDVTDQQTVDRLIKRYKPEAIFHFASFAAEVLSHYVRTHTYDNVLIGTATLVNAAVRYNVPRIVYASSSAVYGDVYNLLDQDCTECVPCDPYGIAKLAAEHDLRAATKLFGIQHVICRLHNVYGERQNIYDPSRNVVAIFARQALTEEPLTIFGDGEQTRQFTYVGDVVKAICQLAFEPEAANQTFNVGSNESLTVNAIADVVCGLLDRGAARFYVRSRPEVTHVRMSHEKLKRAFGIECNTSVTVGIPKMIDWIKEQVSLRWSAGLVHSAHMTNPELPLPIPEANETVESCHGVQDRPARKLHG